MWFFIRCHTYFVVTLRTSEMTRDVKGEPGYLTLEWVLRFYFMHLNFHLHLLQSHLCAYFYLFFHSLSEWDSGKRIKLKVKRNSFIRTLLGSNVKFETIHGIKVKRQKMRGVWIPCNFLGLLYTLCGVQFIYVEDAKMSSVLGV